MRGAPAAQPCHQAHVAGGLGGGGRWAGCVPVFFAELGVGLSDIQAFTEHCFTIAGTKRENRVTAPAAGSPGPGLRALGAGHACLARARARGCQGTSGRGVPGPRCAPWDLPGRVALGGRPAPATSPGHLQPSRRPRHSAKWAEGGASGREMPEKGAFWCPSSRVIQHPAPAAVRAAERSRSRHWVGCLHAQPCPEAQASGRGGGSTQPALQGSDGRPGPGVGRRAGQRRTHKEQDVGHGQGWSVASRGPSSCSGPALSGDLEGGSGGPGPPARGCTSPALWGGPGTTSSA